MSAPESARHPMTVADLLFTGEVLCPERPALWVEGGFVSYGELHSLSKRVGAVISALPPRAGGAAGRQCGLLVGRTLTAYASVLGAMASGCTYVPLNPRFPAARLIDMLRASAADVVVVDRNSLSAARPVIENFPRPLTVLLPDASSPPDWAARAHHHRFLCRAEIERSAPTATHPPLTPDSGVYLLFTSGSTGVPKGVLIRQRNLLAYLRTVLRRYEPTHEDRFTQLFDFSFDLSAHDMFLCWSAGACLYCPPPSAVMAPRDFVRRHELTCWFSVPSTAAMMARLRMLEPGDFPSLRLSLFCGEALPTGLTRAWRRAAPNSIIENLYGPTEATIAVTAYRVPDDDAIAARGPIVPIGLPFPGHEVAVIDAQGRPVADGEAGELCVCGGQVADGYWDTPNAQERFAAPLGCSSPMQRWYRTGDRVMMDRECGLVFLGRLDHQVKIRGHRIDLQEVEGVVREAASSESVAALPYPPGSTELAKYIVAFVAGEPGIADTILAACQKRLPPALVPKHIRFVSDWPLNANGKTDYAALRRQLKDELC
jgi:D-alanine--poly(phosphoribitol) ligase subunit 1